MAGGGRRGWRTRRDAPQWGIVSEPRARIVIIGGGPGGYEAALVAAQLGSQVTVVDSDGLGGACVLTDCVPSKTLIATSTTMSVVHGAPDLGIRVGAVPGGGGAAPGGGRPRWTRPGCTPGSRPWPRPSPPTWPSGWPRREWRPSPAGARWPARTRSWPTASGSGPGPC